MVHNQKVSDEKLLEAYQRTGGNATRTAQLVGITSRNVHERLSKIEAKLGKKLRFGVGSRVQVSRDLKPNPIDLENGVIMVASDCHYWPGYVSTAHRAFVKVASLLKPSIVVVNGDEFDGATISRHDRIGWDKRPSVEEELAEVDARLTEIKKAAKGAMRLGTFGNHTMRFDTYLASHAPAVEGVPGLRYEDRFPDWTYQWAWMVNGHTLIKHRIKNGIHATWTNTADAQISTVTGHLHNLRVTPRSTMSPLNNGHIYGVDTGMLADPWGPQFDYLECGPRNWRSGFAVLTVHDGLLMPPELCQVVEEDVVFFRGNRIEV